MAGILKLKQAAERLRKLPIVGDLGSRMVRAGIRDLASSPSRERGAAIAGLVPKRCGICVHFNLAQGQLAMKRHADFAKAADFLGPSRMGQMNTQEAPSRVSEAARAIRPDLVESFDDYGLCMKWGNKIFWAYEELPAAPEPTDPPCESWE